MPTGRSLKLNSDDIILRILLQAQTSERRPGVCGKGLHSRRRLPELAHQR